MFRVSTLPAALLVGIFFINNDPARAQTAPNDDSLQMAQDAGIRSMTLNAKEIMVDGAKTSSVSSSEETAVTALPDAPGKQNTSSATTRPANQIAGAGFVFHDFPTRRKAYLSDLVGPGAFLSAAFQAGSDQGLALKVGYPSDGYIGTGKHPAHGAVPEWGEGANGYAKRYASRFGMGLVGTTSRYGLGELLRQDVSYHACQCVGVLPRAYHAFAQSLVAHTQSGRAIPSLPALVSPFIAAEVATVAWYPARYNASDALRTSAPLYYGLPLKNLIEEFRKH